MKDLAELEESIAKKFRPWFIKDIQLHPSSDCLESVINKHTNLLCIMNHGGFYGPWAAALAYHYLFLNHGGHARKPTGVAWRGFYKLPIYKQVTRYLTQLEHPLDYPGCQAILTNKTFNDLIILPEGTNCHYFNGRELQPFISPRFIELSIETQTPLLLFVHQGSEHWSIPVKMPERMMPLTRLLPKRYREGLERSRLINIPHMLSGSIPQLNVLCKLYHPSIHPSVLRDRAFAKDIITQEALKIRRMMQNHYDCLIESQLSRQADSELEMSITHPCAEVA